MALIFAIACDAKAEVAEQGHSTTFEPAIDKDPAKPLTPQETVARLLELAESSDWETYVDDYYGEVHKFKDQGDRTALVSRFREDWGGQVIETLRQVQEIEPRLSPNGAEAVFDLGEGEFILYKDGAGRWKFHL
jgi:hypothetical protein